MLFEPSNLPQAAKDLKETPSVVSEVSDHTFVLGSAGSTLNDLLPVLEGGFSYHCPSYGNWSFNHMVAHVLSLIGSAKLFLTSWTISEQPVKELLALMDNGVITDLTCLFDSRVPKQCPNAYQIAQHRFAKLRLCHIHAKLAVLINDKFQVTINSSANLSRNDAIEAYVLTVSETVAQHHAEWITLHYEKAKPFEK